MLPLLWYFFLTELFVNLESYVSNCMVSLSHCLDSKYLNQTRNYSPVVSLVASTVFDNLELEYQ
jgi:hypothetical protein